MRARTILAVDDDVMILGLIEAVVSSNGGDFIGVKTGEECLAVLNQAGLQPHGPCMVILDIEMPGLNGIALLTRIRDDFPNLKSQVAFLTSHKSSTIIEKAQALGCDGFVLKPIDPNRLCDRLCRQFDSQSEIEIKARSI